MLFDCFRYTHPIENRECPVVIGGDYITTESGTGLVHTAPGHGQEDYVTGLKYGLPIFSPVDDDGMFTEAAGKFSGLDVLGDGNAAVIEYLDKHSSIIMVEPYSKLLSHCHSFTEYTVDVNLKNIKLSLKTDFFS